MWLSQSAFCCSDKRQDQKQHDKGFISAFSSSSQSSLREEVRAGTQGRSVEGRQELRPWRMLVTGLFLRLTLNHFSYTTCPGRHCPQ